MDFKKWLDSIGGDGNSKERMPWSGRIPREIELTGPRDDGTIGSLGKSSHWEPTHKSKIVPDLECMVTSRTDKVVRFILSYGGKGSDPIEVFEQNWKAIPQSKLN